MPLYRMQVAATFCFDQEAETEAQAIELARQALNEDFDLPEEMGPEGPRNAMCFPGDSEGVECLYDLADFKNPETR